MKHSLSTSYTSGDSCKLSELSQHPRITATSLQITKLIVREIKWLLQDHTIVRWGKQNLNAGFLKPSHKLSLPHQPTIPKAVQGPPLWAHRRQYLFFSLFIGKHLSANYPRHLGTGACSLSVEFQELSYLHLQAAYHCLLQVIWNNMSLWFFPEIFFLLWIYKLGTNVALVPVNKQLHSYMTHSPVISSGFPQHGHGMALTTCSHVLGNWLQDTSGRTSLVHTSGRVGCAILVEEVWRGEAWCLRVRGNLWLC